jgi:hypothetical protein
LCPPELRPTSITGEAGERVAQLGSITVTDKVEKI